MSNVEQPGTNAPVSLGDEAATKQVVIEAVLGLWDVVNNLTRLRPSKRDHFQVSLFGSARLKPGSFSYEETKRTAAALAEMGCNIITGGGPGLMQAANEGAASANRKGQSIGVRVHLPFEQNANAFVDMAYEHRTFFTRLHQFVLASDAFIVAPGGIGTVLEMLMIWQLLQVKHLENVPLILVGDMWNGLIRWSREALLATDPPLANAEDIDIPVVVENADQAIAIISAAHRKWKSQ